MMDPITNKILSMMTTILLLMSQLVSQQSTQVLTVSTLPYLPKTSFIQRSSNNLGAYNPSGGGTYRLQSSAGLSDSSITLSSFKEPISNIKYTMSYLNSSIEYGTLDPNNSNSKEFISFTGITQNSDNSATLTGVTRGLGFSYPYTASTTLQQTHSGQSIFILSNPPQMTNMYANKSNYEVITGAWAFSTAPTSTDECSASTEYCTKAYIDALGVQGAATSTETNLGVVELATNSEIAGSIASSTFGGPLVLPSRVASSTYNALYTNVIPVTKTNNGLVNTIDSNFIATSSNYTWGGTHNFTQNIGQGTSTPYASLSVAGASGVVANIFTATSSKTSTFLYASSTAITISGTASTTDLIVSGTQTGGTMTYTASSTIFAVSSSATTYTGAIPTNANHGLIQWWVTDGTATWFNTASFARTGLTGAIVGDTQQTTAQDGKYTIDWSGNDLTVTELVDDSGDSSINGTVYWYK